MCMNIYLQFRVLQKFIYDICLNLKFFKMLKKFKDVSMSLSHYNF